MITSIRRSYDEYLKQSQHIRETQDKTMVSAYSDALEQEIVPGTVFYLNFGRHDDHSTGDEIFRNLKDKKLFASYVLRNNYDDMEDVTFIKRRKPEFFEKLATCEYIIADSSVTAYFVNRPGQKVITILDNNNANNLADKAKITKQLLKSDVVVDNGNAKQRIEDALGQTWCFGGDYLTPDEVTDGINNDTIKELTNENDKNRVFIGAFFDYPEKWIHRLLSFIDEFKDSEIIVGIDNNQIEEMDNYLERLPKGLAFVNRQGWFLANEDQQDVYAYSKVDLVYFENSNDIFENIPKEIYIREFKRLAGKKKIDTFVLLEDRKDSRTYWYLIGMALDIDDKRIGFDKGTDDHFLLQNLELCQKYEENLKRIYENFSTVYFWGEEERKNFLEKYEDTDELEKKSEVRDMSNYLDIDIDSFSFDYLDGNAICYNIYDGGKGLDIIKIDEPTVDIILIENDKECDVVHGKKVKEFLAENKNIVIVDLNDLSESIYSNLAEARNDVYFLAGALFFKALLKFADNIYVAEDNQKLQDILKNKGIEYNTL